MENRIELLRSRALEQKEQSEEFFYHFYKTYDDLQNCPEYIRYADSFYTAFTNLSPVISTGELIVGKRASGSIEFEADQWEKKYKPLAQMKNEAVGTGQDSHMAIDYELLLSEGILGIIRKIEDYLHLPNDYDLEKKEFYKACRRCLEAVIVHSENYALKADELSNETTDENQKNEFQKIAEICRKVPANPAENFYEAVQSVHFLTYCLSFNPFRMNPQQFQLGHPDRYLLPFYEKDIHEGILTKQEAQLLLDCLGIQINMRVPNGLSSGYMVGGRDSNGQLIANELTELCMRVIDDIRLVYPAVGFCYSEGMPEKYLELACDLLLKGYSHPAIFNDEIITKGLMYYGTSTEEAHNYIHSTCVEITPVAASNVWVASPYTNMPQILLDCMDKEHRTFDELIQEIFQQIDSKIRDNFLEENQKRKIRAENSMNPLLSCFVKDCLKNGKDIDKGGAKYNWIMPSFVGMANLVDSLYAIKEYVFEQQNIKLSEFKEILKSDYNDQEILRLKLLRKIPKYGNDLDEVDQYFEIFTEHIAQECKKYHGLFPNGNLIPSVFCWIMHEAFGKETIATPDGRKSYFPLGDGSGPCQGREENGPTASILSSTKWEHYKFIGGVAVNLKFSKASLGPHSSASIISLIKTYMKRGGFELQINVVDNETLKKARISPEEYRDLVVRIGGYSDYFTRLTPQMQEEVIMRTSHNV